MVNLSFTLILLEKQACEQKREQTKNARSPRPRPDDLCYDNTNVQVESWRSKRAANTKSSKARWLELQYWKCTSGLWWRWVVESRGQMANISFSGHDIYPCLWELLHEEWPSTEEVAQARGVIQINLFIANMQTRHACEPSMSRARSKREREPLFIANMKVRHACEPSMIRARSKRERESLYLVPTWKPDMHVSPAWVDLDAREREREPLSNANMQTKLACEPCMIRARSKRESLYLLPTWKLDKTCVWAQHD